VKSIPGAKQIETEKSGHYLHVNEPELVINAVSTIVTATRLAR
jgi:hypothetical protein